MARTTGIEQHPDIVALRNRYDLASARPAAQMADGLILLSGLYLAISPWVLGFNGMGRLAINDLITGIAVALLALGLSSAYGHTHGIAWCIPLIGIWTIIAPWVINGWSTGVMHRFVLSHIVVGAVITLMGLATMGVGLLGKRRAAHHGPGYDRPDYDRPDYGGRDYGRAGYGGTGYGTEGTRAGGGPMGRTAGEPVERPSGEPSGRPTGPEGRSRRR